MKLYILLFVILSTIISGCNGASDTPAPNTPAPITPPSYLTAEEAFTQVLQQHDLPAISGAYIEGDQVIEQFSLGVRKQGGSQQVSINDSWHIGSLTKSFTATLTAILVEQGQLSWSTSISDVFEEGEYSAKYSNVTIEQLLSHTGGIHSEIMGVIGWDNYFTSNDPVIQQRAQMSSDLLSMSGNGIGTFNYSNGSYVIAGHMLERIMIEQWEQLVSEYLLLPLGIRDAKFGAPDDGFTDSQPYGHRFENNTWTPVNPSETYSDNPKAMGPAGTINMSLDSLAKYTIEHLNGRSGNSPLLSQSGYEKLHTPLPGTEYALGWFISGTNVYHMGTNTMWYAHIGMDFGAKEIAVIALTNVGGDHAIAVTDNIIDVLLDRNY